MKKKSNSQLNFLVPKHMLNVLFGNVEPEPIPEPEEVKEIGTLLQRFFRFINQLFE